MQLLSLLVNTALALSLSAPVSALRHATRDQIVKREKFNHLAPRQSTTTTPPCKRSYPTKKRELLAPDHAMFTTWELFNGEILDPEEVASFLLGDGTWLASNGSVAVDYTYKADIELFRQQRWGVSDWNLVKTFRRNVGSWGGKQLAWHIVKGFEDKDKLFIISDNYAIPSFDIIRLMKALLAVPGWEEVLYTEHVVPRPALEAVVHAVCPGLGTEYRN